LVRESDTSTELIAGTRCGHLLTLKISDQTSKQITWNSEAMGVAPVDVFPTQGTFDGGVAAMACCDNNLIMMSNFSFPKLRFHKKNFVWLTDSNDPSMPSPSVHSAFDLGFSLSGYSGHMSLMLLAGSRLLFADIWPHFSLVPRCLPLNGTPTRVIFSQAWNCLVVGLLQDGKSTLAFIDPDTGSHIAYASDKDKKPSEFISGLGHTGDRIYGLSEWLYVKDGRTFAFLLVTTREGRLLIVSVNKIDHQPDVGGGTRRLQYWTRYKKVMGKPIYSVVGDDDGIIYCVDKTIHWDVLDLAEKKLRPMKQYDVDSPVTSLQVSNGKIFALTTMHSLEVIDHRAGGETDMALIHTDAISRNTIHMIDIGTEEGHQTIGNWPVTMLSDHRGALFGVWIPWGQKNKEFRTIFEAILPSSIRRLIRARSRPLWQELESQDHHYGVIASDEDGSEVFGVSLDGSLRHFTLINLELWRVLSLIQNLALRSRLLNAFGGTASDSDSVMLDDEFDIEPRVHSKLMHVDGDVLHHCLRSRLLESIVGVADGLDLFCEYLDGLGSGRWTDEFRDGVGNSEERNAAYFRLGYDILEYVLAPAL
jgi:hypothetical protein